MKRLAIVVQRYGIEVNGGSEFYARLLAERLSRYYYVEVLTTCAIDYETWRNEYKPGVDYINNVKVRRFPVNTERDPILFRKLSERMLSRRHTYIDEINWMYAQGPQSHALLDYIKDNHEQYKRIVFMTYLFFTTFFGMQLVPYKSVMIPTAHDEFPIYFDIYRHFFHIPVSIVYNSVEEKRLINSLFHNEYIKSEVVGIGIDVPQFDRDKEFLVGANYIIYVGRIDESKGCKELCEFFIRYKAKCGGDGLDVANETKKEVETDSANEVYGLNDAYGTDVLDEANGTREIHRNTATGLKLVLVGKKYMEIPEHKDIIYAGFLSEEDKLLAMNNAKLLVLPSIYESLSMVVLESMYLGKPVLVNSKCKVTKGHCQRSNAGLYYSNYPEFHEMLNLMLTNEELRISMGRNGSKYVKDNYNWEVIENQLINLIEHIR